MRFLWKNPALAAGIALPVIITILFALATIVPGRLVPPPQHDMLFTSNTGAGRPGGSEELKFAVEEGVLKSYRRFNSQLHYAPETKLYLFEARTLGVREIFVPPAGTRGSEHWQEFPLPAAQSWRLAASSVAPDGYEVQGRDRGASTGGLWPFFGGGAPDGITIAKNGRRIRVKLPVADTLYGHDTRFVAWVTAASPP
jgi:hypothetical protein